MSCGRVAFTVELFAILFYSKFHCPKSSGVNAFLFSWAGENCFLAPPVSLVPQVLLHLNYYKTSAVLVVPFWKSAAFYPMILDTAQKFKSFVTDFLVFEHDSLQQGPNDRCYIGSPSFTSKVFALKLDFTSS